MKNVSIYTDGACRGNQNAINTGAYAYIIQYKENTKEFKQAVKNTTNNQMELTAVIEGLRALKEKCKVDLYSDSQYVISGITEWVPTWKKNNWRTSNKKSVVKNIELWQELDRLVVMHDVTFIKVKGHSDNEGNNRADSLCNIAMDIA